MLLLHSGYHLQDECGAALADLGHHVALARVDNLSCAAAIRTLLAQLVAHRPDFVLTINHLGFDDEGQVGDILTACQMPVACWYCDSPLFVLRGGALPAPTVTSLFMWERALIPTLRALGAIDVHHLPLGCDLSKFAAPAGPARAHAHPIAFVGNSMHEACCTWEGRLGERERHLARDLRHRLAVAPRAPLAEPVRALQAREPQLHAWDALGAATFRATRRLRDDLLRALPPERLHVFGDRGWHGALAPAVTLHGPIPYGPQLAAVYAASAVNLNATSLQMPTAVNQRLFDVPAAGGFLLTDAQDDVAELFAVGEEAVVYGHKDELTDLCGYYAQHPSERAAIVWRAQGRIRRCHTYTHRLAQVVATMRRRYA